VQNRVSKESFFSRLLLQFLNFRLGRKQVMGNMWMELVEWA
jgi:hypothetical protein